MKYIKIDKENFFNEIGEKHPEALKKFCKWIDDYKKVIMWSALFNPVYKLKEDSNIQEGAIVDNMTAPKFHDIPFAMQEGIMREFFIHQNIIFIVEPHGTQKGYTWTVIDMIKQEAYRPSTDANDIDITAYAKIVVCTIDAIKTCFEALEQKLQGYTPIINMSKNE